MGLRRWLYTKGKDHQAMRGLRSHVMHCLCEFDERRRGKICGVFPERFGIGIGTGISKSMYISG